jgi:hypothetical protein
MNVFVPITVSPSWLRLSLRGCVLLIVLSGFAKGQQPAQPSRSDGGEPRASATLPAETNIIQVTYQCPKQPQTSEVCSIAVTKKEFDALVQALDPGMTTANRQSLATEYSRLLIMAAEARHRGIDQQPELQTLLRFSALQLMATRLVREINAVPTLVTTEDVQKYLGEHRTDYREVLLDSIVLPAQSNGRDQGGVPAVERARALYKRLQNGEDFTVVKTEVNGSSAAKSASSDQRAWLRCGSLPESQRAVCDLEPGKISNPIAAGPNYLIYRLESRRDLKLEDVADEIRAFLARDRADREIHRVRTPVSLQLDERYFGKLPKPDLAEKHGLHYPAVTTAPPEVQHRH